MTLSNNGVDLIKDFEGFRAKAYLDSVGVPTIGFGSTMWNDGRKVKLGETITIEDAEKLLHWEVVNKTTIINILLKGIDISQNQFNALASFTYNVGIGALTNSTLLKKVKACPNDFTIRNEFMKWNKGHRNGKLITLPGLTKRRAEEADLYFTI